MPAFHNAKYPYESRDKVGVEPTFHNLVMRFPEILLIHKFGGEGWIRTSEALQVTCAPKLD